MEGRKSMLGSQRSGIALVQNMLGERLSSKLSGFGSGNVYMDMPAYDNPLSDDDYDPELGSEVTSETKAPKRKGLRITFQVSQERVCSYAEISLGLIAGTMQPVRSPGLR